jgi:hypothetical protein
MSSTTTTSMSMIEPPPPFDINDFFYNRRQTMVAMKDHPTLLFVRPIPQNMNIDHLYDVFSVYGIVDDITIRSGKYGYSDYATVYMRDWFYPYMNVRTNICDGNVCMIRYGSHPAAVLHVALYKHSPNPNPNPKHRERPLYDSSAATHTHTQNKDLHETTISSGVVPEYRSSPIEQKYNHMTDTPYNSSSQKAWVSSLSTNSSKQYIKSNTIYKQHERRLVVDYQGGIGLIPPKPKKKRINWPPLQVEKEFQ